MAFQILGNKFGVSFEWVSVPLNLTQGQDTSTELMRLKEAEGGGCSRECREHRERVDSSLKACLQIMRAVRKLIWLQCD